MNPPTQPTQLKPGDVRQAGDTIEERRDSGPYTTGETHTIKWHPVRPVSLGTIGRVILPADLMNARFFRP